MSGGSGEPLSEEQAPEIERIVAAAIRVGPVVHTGPHHATIIHQIVACGGETPVTGAQGFMTSRGRMVSRSIARKIAFSAGQVASDDVSLLSEELWIVPEPNWSELLASQSREKALREAQPPTTEQILAPFDDPANDGLLVSEKVEKCLEAARHTSKCVVFQPHATRHTDCDCQPERRAYDELDLLRAQVDLAVQQNVKAGAALLFLRKQCDLSDARALRAETSAKSLKEALEKVINLAKEAHREWDSDNDPRVGKILIALAYGHPGYRADIDAIWFAYRSSQEIAAYPCGRSS